MTGKAKGQVAQVCEILESFGVTDDPQWLAVLLFVRNLVPHLTVFSQEQKADIQKLILKEMAESELTPGRFQAIITHLDALILQNVGTKELEAELVNEKRSSMALYDEMNAIFMGLQGSSKRQEDRLDKFSRNTVKVVEGEDGKKEIVKRVRSLVNEVVSEIKEEAREWEVRAKSLERTANYDALLTELHNRRSLDSFLTEAVINHNSRKRPLSMLMIDVDHFKSVNDTYGHQVGDDVLRALAKIMTEHAQQFNGYAARYGGEELVLLAENMVQADAGQRAEALRRDVEEYEFQSRQGGKIVGDPIHFTVSIGVAELQPGWSAEALVQAADKALYRAKRSGRNIVAHYENGKDGRVSWAE